MDSPVEDSPVGEVPVKGLRAWATVGLSAHGLNKTDVPPQTGGTIIFQDKEEKIFAVQWDIGMITIHSLCEFAKELVCIGDNTSLEEYLLKK